MRRLGSLKGAEEVKEHPYFADLNWNALYRRKSLQFSVPEPYLVQYAKSIIQVSPYMAAGHPQTRGLPISADHPQYVPGWSFIDNDS